MHPTSVTILTMMHVCMYFAHSLQLHPRKFSDFSITHCRRSLLRTPLHNQAAILLSLHSNGLEHSVPTISANASQSPSTCEVIYQTCTSLTRLDSWHAIVPYKGEVGVPADMLMQVH